VKDAKALWIQGVLGCESHGKIFTEQILKPLLWLAFVVAASPRWRAKGPFKRPPCYACSSTDVSKRGRSVTPPLALKSPVSRAGRCSSWSAVDRATRRQKKTGRASVGEEFLRPSDERQHADQSAVTCTSLHGRRQLSALSILIPSISLQKLAYVTRHSPSYPRKRVSRAQCSARYPRLPLSRE
jgi:hypothetical protein